MAGHHFAHPQFADVAQGLLFAPFDEEFANGANGLWQGRELQQADAVLGGDLGAVGRQRGQHAGERFGVAEGQRLPLGSGHARPQVRILWRREQVRKRLVEVGQHFALPDGIDAAGAPRAEHR